MSGRISGGSRPRSFLVAVGLCSTLLGAAGASAQNARVVATSSTRGAVLELDFDTGSSERLNDDADERQRFQSIVFRNDGAQGVQSIAADDLAGQVLYYSESSGTGSVILDATLPGHPRLPTGLSLDAANNLYGLSVEGTRAGLWVVAREPAGGGGGTGGLPGGYMEPVGVLDSDVTGVTNLGADRLADSLVVTSSQGILAAGDVLVLANNPPTLLRYHGSEVRAFLNLLGQGGAPTELEPETLIHPASATTLPEEQRFPEDARPLGLAIEPGGNLLVSSANGVVYSFGPDGTRNSSAGVFVDFVSGLAEGKYQIAAGNQDGAARVFLSDRSGRRALRYTVQPDGTGLLDATVVDLAVPFGIDTTTSSVTQTPAGSEVTVNTSNIMTSRISNVVNTGATNVTEFIFEDPREAEIATPVGQPLHRSLFLEEVSALLPVGIEIPPYVRALRKDDPVNGPPTFILLVVDTTFEVVGPVNHESDESLVLGYDPDCQDPEPSLRPRMFWVPNLDEPPSPEGPRFINLSTACGTPPSLLSLNRTVRSKGVTRRFSLFLVGARDTRSWDVIAQAQLDGLGAVLAASSCVPQPVLSAIQAEYDKATATFANLRLRATVVALQRLLAVVLNNPAAFTGCADNESGGLVARTLATIFTLGSSERDPDSGLPR